MMRLSEALVHHVPATTAVRTGTQEAIPIPAGVNLNDFPVGSMIRIATAEKLPEYYRVVPDGMMVRLSFQQVIDSLPRAARRKIEKAQRRALATYEKTGRVVLPKRI